jgi:hypothetical protein
LKAKAPRGIRVLGAVTIAITLLVFLVIASVVYSAYADYNAVSGELRGGPGASVKRTIQGSSELVSLNVTVPNRGLYTLSVTISCNNPVPSSNTFCQPSTVTVKPGEQQVLELTIKIQSVAAYRASNGFINGTVNIQMEPFASLSIGVNFGSLVGNGGP